MKRAEQLPSIFSFRQPFSLMRWFSVLSLISIGASCIVSSYLLSRFLTEQMLYRDGTVMLVFVQSVTDIENVKARAAGREPDIRDPGMYELFDHLAGVPSVLRTNIYAPDLTLAWSSEKELIGQRFTDNPELEKAMDGEMEIEVGKTSKTENPKNEHMFLSDQPVRFVETYLPLRDNIGGQIIGVAEVYRIPTELFETIDRGHTLIWTTGLLSGFCLYVTLFWIVRRADTTTREQHARLIESETLAAVGDMGSAVAHGIRNPLASIRSSAELCIDDKSSAQTRSSANDIVGQVDRMEKWVRDLLSYAQPEHNAPVHVELETVIRQLCENMSHNFINNRIVLTLTMPEALPPVVGDEGALEQVFLSILTNAMEAMPDGGGLTISAERTSRGAMVTVKVSDTGVGISDEHKAKLFTAFHTTKAKGMGLGLVLVRRIVRRYGGEMSIDSVRGSGTQVMLTFAAQVRP